MPKRFLPLFLAALASGLAIFAACSPDSVPVVPVSASYTPYGGLPGRTASISHDWPDPYSRSGRQSSSSGGTKSASELYSEVRVKRDYLSPSARGRTRKAMNPGYITIHSTQNWSRGADSDRHSLALKRGALGRISWHYTVDDDHAVQHLPTNEQGNHADYDGPGNKHSIGIEMCEDSGNDRARTLDRTAKLTAWLMYKHGIPISRVVPHYRWPRYGKNPANKNCPHFLLENGKPGRKWAAYVATIDRYHRQIVSNPSAYARR